MAQPTSIRLWSLSPQGHPMCAHEPRDCAGEATEEGASLWPAVLPHCDEWVPGQCGPHPTTPLRPRQHSPGAPAPSPDPHAISQPPGWLRHLPSCCHPWQPATGPLRSPSSSAWQHLQCRRTNSLAWGTTPRGALGSRLSPCGGPVAWGTPGTGTHMSTGTHSGCRTWRHGASSLRCAGSGAGGSSLLRGEKQRHC